MSMKNVLSVAFAASLLVAMTPNGAVAQSQGASPAGAADQCRVVADRTAAPGVFDVTRQVVSGGGCVCYIYTGPQSQGAATEARVSDLLAAKSCPAARPMAAQTGAAAGGGLGGAGTALLVGAAAAAAGFGVYNAVKTVSP